MEVLGEDLFVKLQEKMDFIPHTQSYGWLKYTIAKRNKSVIFFSNSIENTLICCWGEIYKIPFIGKILIVQTLQMPELKISKNALTHCL